MTKEEKCLALKRFCHAQECQNCFFLKVDIDGSKPCMDYNFDEMPEHLLNKVYEEYAGQLADQEEKPDVVNHPAHYKMAVGVEVIQITEQLNFCRGNAVKYICRAGKKDPTKELEDLQKAKWYIEREIGRISNA